MATNNSSTIKLLLRRTLVRLVILSTNNGKRQIIPLFSFHPYPCKIVLTLYTAARFKVSLQHDKSSP